MAGMDSHVFLPMTTALRRPGSSVCAVSDLKYAISLGSRQGSWPSRPMPISSLVAATTTWKSRAVEAMATVEGCLEEAEEAKARGAFEAARGTRGETTRVSVRGSDGAATDQLRRTVSATARRPRAIVGVCQQAVPTACVRFEPPSSERTASCEARGAFAWARRERGKRSPRERRNDDAWCDRARWSEASEDGDEFSKKNKCGGFELRRRSQSSSASRAGESARFLK